LFAECRYAECYYDECCGVSYLVVHPFSSVNLLTIAAAASARITPKKFRRIKSYFKLVFPISNFLIKQTTFCSQLFISHSLCKFEYDNKEESQVLFKKKIKF
jgi:hypothetical protein